jgi:TolA-binding protein
MARSESQAHVGSAPLLLLFIVTLVMGCASTRGVSAGARSGELDQLRGGIERLTTSAELARQEGEAIRVALAELIREQAAEAARQSVMLAQRLDTLSTTLAGLAARVEALATRLDRVAAGSELEALTNALAVLTARLDEIDARIVARESPPGVGEAAPGVSLRPFAPTEPTISAGPPTDLRPGTEATPRDLYQAAYLDFSRGNYALAIGGFREFVRRHPDDEVADNAQYWIGEAYLSPNCDTVSFLSFVGAASVHSRDGSTPSLPIVAKSIRPVSSRPLATWNARSAASVLGPATPSIGPGSYP